MIKKLLFGAGAAYLARKFMGGRRDRFTGYERTGGLFGDRGSRMGRGRSW